eukprot:3900872-Rhodomonas_salina.1
MTPRAHVTGRTWTSPTRPRRGRRRSSATPLCSGAPTDTPGTGVQRSLFASQHPAPVSYTHLRAHETEADL